MRTGSRGARPKNSGNGAPGQVALTCREPGQWAHPGQTTARNSQSQQQHREQKRGLYRKEVKQGAREKITFEKSPGRAIGKTVAAGDCSDTQAFLLYKK